MRQPRYWSTAALLAIALLAQSLLTSVRADSPDISLAARLGAELGALASAGVDVAAPDGATTATPSPTANATSTPTASPTSTATAAPTATTDPTPVPSNGKLIFIDPGHGGADVGAVHHTAGGGVDLTEAESNLAISLKLADMLRQDGYDVMLSRTVDSFIIPGASSATELQKRLDIANGAGADLYICVHNNGVGDPSARGTEVWYCGDRSYGQENRRLAELVQQNLVASLRGAGYDTNDRGIHDDASMGHFAVTGPYMARPSTMPAIIGESLFLTNDQDAAALAQDDIRAAIARGYLQGINAYFGYS